MTAALIMQLKKEKKLPKLSKTELLFLFLAFLFSIWLMWHTFDYKDNNILIATKAWSDFSANIPLVRSFSLGNNFPPIDPLFANVPSHYHFLFYLLVGFLEKIGLPLNWALNFPSAIGFFWLLAVIFFTAKILFKSRSLGFLSVILFLFNGSFSFLEFFKTHLFSLQTLSEIINNTAFPSFGPYDGKIVSAFWNLNIYTNQRHFAAALAIVLGLCLLIVQAETKNKIISNKIAFALGIILAIFPFFHSLGFAVALVILGCFFLLFPRQRKPLLFSLAIGILIGLPQMLLMQPGNTQSNFRFHPGFLIANKLTIINFINYWWMNFGLVTILAPLGFIKSTNLAKKVFLAFLPLFIIGNLFQFSPEMAANHKFFNLFLIVANFFTAYAVYLIWQKKIIGKLISIVLLFFLTFSGIIDFFPIKNDSMITLADAPKNPDIAWIRQNTPARSAFMTTSYLYHPASLAGRPVFLGWPYFPWAGGLDSTGRSRIIKQFFQETNKSQICKTLKDQQIDYIALDQPSDDFPFNPLYWQKNFTPLYQNPQTGFKIYQTKKICY